MLLNPLHFPVEFDELNQQELPPSTGDSLGWWGRSRLPLAFCRLLRDVDPINLRDIDRAKHLAQVVLDERMRFWRASNLFVVPSSRPIIFFHETRAALAEVAACTRAACPDSSTFSWLDTVEALAPDLCRAFPDVVHLEHALQWSVPSEPLHSQSGSKRSRLSSSNAASPGFQFDNSWTPSADVDHMSLQELQREHMHLLVRDLKQGKVVLFTGAGLFASAGLPNWKDLLLELIDRYDQHCCDASSTTAEVGRSKNMVLRLRRLMDDPKHYEQIAQVCTTTLNRSYTTT
jgi:hypothetical protein